MIARVRVVVTVVVTVFVRAHMKVEVKETRAELTVTMPVASRVECESCRADRDEEEQTEPHRS